MLEIFWNRLEKRINHHKRVNNRIKDKGICPHIEFISCVFGVHGTIGTTVMS